MTKQVVIDNDYITIRYTPNRKMEKEVTESVMKFLTKHEAFSGEVICQSDSVIIDLPDFMANLADEVLSKYVSITYK